MLFSFFISHQYVLFQHVPSLPLFHGSLAHPASLSRLNENHLLTSLASLLPLCNIQQVHCFSMGVFIVVIATLNIYIYYFPAIANSHIPCAKIFSITFFFGSFFFVIFILPIWCISCVIPFILASTVTYILMCDSLITRRCCSHTHTRIHTYIHALFIKFDFDFVMFLK